MEIGNIVKAVVFEPIDETPAPVEELDEIEIEVLEVGSLSEVLVVQ